MEESNDTVDRNNPIITSIEEKIESLRPLTPKCCIYRVPHRLRRDKEAFYIPTVVSIGPLHHGDEGLEKMEEKKMIYLNDFRRRNNVNLGDCFQTVWRGLKTLRSCYEEDLRYEEDELVKIIVVDAVFVVETLFKCSHAKYQDDNDRMFNPWILPDVQTEFLLLENQLPFFILEDLWQLETERSITLIECCCNFFKICHLLKESEKHLEKIKESPKHLLDLLRIFYEPPSRTAQGQDGKNDSNCAKLLRIFYEPASRTAKQTVPRIRNATRLHEAGVELKVKETNDLLDIDFKKGTLEIPELEFTDNTESILRNLIAYEQSHNCGTFYVSHYATAMDSIISTPEDVDLLVQKKIVVNLLGHSDDVSTIINRLGDGVLIDYENSFHYAQLYEKIDSYCGTKWHQWKATLKHDYFNTPWAIISFIAAVVLIALTIIQTACSIISTTNGD